MGKVGCQSAAARGRRAGRVAAAAGPEEVGGEGVGDPEPSGGARAACPAAFALVGGPALVAFPAARAARPGPR